MTHAQAQQQHVTESFKDYLYNQSKSPKTIQDYCSDISAYFKFTNSTYLTKNNIIKYKSHLLQNHRPASSINRILSSLKQYNNYLIESGKLQKFLIVSNDYISIQHSNNNPNDVTKFEMNNFIKSIKENEPYRNYAIVMVLANTGLRIAEVLSLRLDDIDLDSNEGIIIGKGSKQREFIIFPEAVKAIREYVLLHRKGYKYSDSSPYLFISSKAPKMATASINAIFNKYSNKITPHKLRHYFATEYYRKTKDLAKVQDQLGHSSPVTTRKYTHLSKQEKKKDLKLISIG